MGEDFLRATLGATGRTVHRIGVASSFGVGGRDLEAAVEEHGVSYLYWGSLRTRTFGAAIRALTRRGLRERLFVVIQSYARLGSLVRPSLCLALRRLGLDHADLLLLGMWNAQVPGRILEAARRCQDRGLVRHLGVSTHQRPLAPALSAPGSGFDVVHLRYNAAHRGAERDVFPHLAPRPTRAGLVAFTATSWRQLLRPTRGRAQEAGGLEPLTAGDCYRFVLSRPEIDVCMTGPANGTQLRAALAAAEQGPLEAADRERIERYGDAVYAAPGGVRARLLGAGN